MQAARISVVLSALLAPALLGCFGDVTDPDDPAGELPGDGDPDGSTDPVPTDTSDLQFCVDETNRLRALEGKPPLARSTALEAFAAEGARVDSQMQSAHYHFSSTSGGGIAFAENECPSFLGWRIMGDVRNTIARCLEAFYDEGPGGGHYDNMMGNYDTVGCGVYVDGNAITIVQDLGR